MSLQMDLNLYLVSDRTNMSEETFLNTIEQGIKGGVSFVQLREKETPAKDIINLAFKLKEITTKYNVPLVIDDRVDIAMICDLDGVHVGQDDIDVRYARKLLGDNKIIGVSTKTVEQALLAQKNGANYLGVGAVYPTTTKVITKLTPVETLRDICKSVSIPVVAIGGINKGNVENLANTGISGIAVVSAIMKSQSPFNSAKELKEIRL